uniref:Uncharacterized protein n=1 Tax=Setaria italica TaxID=4555 RepID=K3Y495_SETIT
MEHQDRILYRKLLNTPHNMEECSIYPVTPRQLSNMCQL